MDKSAESENLRQTLLQMEDLMNSLQTELDQTRQDLHDAKDLLATEIQKSAKLSQPKESLDPNLLQEL